MLSEINLLGCCFMHYADVTMRQHTDAAVVKTANQVANGKTLRTMDHGSVVLSGAFSAMSYGLCKGVESLMGDASEAVKNFVTTIRGASTALVGVGASNIHNDNQKRKGAAILDCWSRRENHYRRWATR